MTGRQGTRRRLPGTVDGWAERETREMEETELGRNRSSAGENSVNDRSKAVLHSSICLGRE